jgi:dipeptidase
MLLFSHADHKFICCFLDDFFIAALRRQWRVLSKAAPSLKLSGDFGSDNWGISLPFSVKVDKKLSVQDVMSLNRDHYEGTPYDLTKGLAAGPYGDPNRYDVAPVDGMTMQQAIGGSYERAISMYRTSYSVIAQARSHLPNQVGGRVWFAPSTPANAAYVPLYVTATTIPKPYTTGSLFRYESDVAFWKFNSVGNYAARWYSFAMVDVRETIGTLNKCCAATPRVYIDHT